MTFKTRLALAALPLLAFSAPAAAHRQWLLPSSTVLSGSGDWVTVDAAVSNELFYFDHVPMRLDSIVITAPDGSTAAPANASTGKYRSTFDVELKQPGTWRIASVNQGIMASWTGADGKPVRWRGDAKKFETEVPKDAKDLHWSRMAGRVETFVTEKAPTPVKPTGVGLEMAPITHPNDLVAGEAASFRLLLDGKPAAGMDVDVVPGGARYRDKVGESKVKTGPDGKFSITWPAAGMYWISASNGGNREGGMGGPQAEGARRPAAPPLATQNGERRVSYVAVLEVMPQ